MASSPCGECDPNESTDDSARPWGPEDPELERVWFSAQATEWRSLALVPASDDVGVIGLASAFSALGLRDHGEAIGVADLRDVPVPNLRGPIDVIRWHIRRGERVIVAVSPCHRSAATVPVVRAADCAILCVALGATRIAEANATVKQVGADFFIGTVLVRPDADFTVSWAGGAYRRLKAAP